MPPMAAALGERGREGRRALRAEAVRAPARLAARARAASEVQQTCAACHGADGKGNPALGAPNLTDTVWLHGSGRAGDHRDHHTTGETNQMPAHKDLLAEAQIHLLAAYVWGLSQAGAAEASAGDELTPPTRHEPPARPPADAESSRRSTRSARRSIRARCTAGSPRWRWALVWLTQLVFYGLPGSVERPPGGAVRPRPRASSTSSAWCSGRRTSSTSTVLLIVSALVAVPVHRGRRAPVVRLRLPADGLHRDLHVDRAQDRGRPHGAHAARQPRRSARASSRLKAAKHGAVDRARAVDRLHLRRLLHADPRAAARVLAARAGPWETFWVAVLRLRHLRQRRLDARAGVQVHVPLRALPERDVRPDTLIVTYDAERGEPRGLAAARPTTQAPGLGDCVDCSICVQVCPTGIDIRNGLQYECIGCAACIDGCDQVMDKMG